MDKRIHIHFTDAKEYDKVIVNGQEVQTGTDPLSGKLVVTLADELLLEDTRIIIE